MNSPTQARPALTGRRSDFPPKSGKTSLEGVAHPWLHHDELALLEQVKHVLLNSRRLTTHPTYLQ